MVGFVRERQSLKYTKETEMNYIVDYRARTDLIDKYKNNSLLLYALQLRFNISDITVIASDALTDGGDDKKCDLIYVAPEMGIAVVAQSYMKQNPQNTDLAPSNKASDLNTASAWVFAQNTDEIPERIREQVKSLQSSIKDGTISNVYFWYVHNLNECNNPTVREELVAMQSNSKAAVKTLFPQNEIEIIAMEVGNETIEKWYNTSSKQISITDSFEVETVNKGFEIQGEKWTAYVTAVAASWLKKLYNIYKDDLFSGNPRNYLGAGKKKNKINLGIIETIGEQPDNFWVYNNGVTALVSSYKISENNSKLTVTGITIINGAQTTGAISNAEKVDNAWVPIRFIKCGAYSIVDEIISNNNKQNEILSSDLRSNDMIQNKLRAEFEKYDKLFYSGGRRGNIRPSRSKEVLDPYVVAQALLAFHGDCVTAYNYRTDLWSNDQLYSSIFKENLSAEHIIFTYSLARGIDSYKIRLQQKGSERTEIEDKQFIFLSKRGSKMLFLYTVGRCMEGIIGKKIVDNMKLQFKDNFDFDKLISLWEEVTASILPISFQYLETVLKDGLKNKEQSERASTTVVGILTGIQTAIQLQLKDFIELVAS